ncbi:amidohydrolase [Tenacibaculum sp. SDUM215027]|uniref:amidohydrolase n=1 Tax=Tenacibaculum sp. SDUM215027 TaxID=3422596 RepID=UPI003D3183AC
MKNSTNKLFAIFCIVLVILTSCNNQEKNKAAKAEPYKLQQTIFYNGDIITMEGEKPQYVETVVQREGKIVFVGSKDEAFKKYKGKAEEVDLKGKTMLPGFLDGHSHMYNVGFTALCANILPPPDGPGANFNSIIKTVNEWKESENGKFIINKMGWIVANGYDDSQLEEKTHPTKEILDQISTKIPVIIMHQSGHLACVNSKALEISGYNKGSKVKGGAIRMDKNGNPSGVLEEAAFFNVFLPVIGKKTDAELQALNIQKGQEEYAKNGYTTAQEGRSTVETTDALEQAARDNKLFIDVVSYPDIIWNKEAVIPEFYNQEHTYNNHYRIGGVKLTLDGSPQGKTAWLKKCYHVNPEGQDGCYKGYPIMSDEKAIEHVKTAFKNKWQILCHTNGDAAIGQYLTAVDSAIKEFGYPDHRSVMIHGQTLRKNQIPELVRLQIYPSLFPMHTYYWGDWHRESVLGKERAVYISPCRDVIDAGLTITSHHDAPVTFPNSMRVLDATINRITRSGYILGSDQRITPYEGLKTLTEWSAKQYFEEDTKGTLTEGKIADFVILDKNPLKIAPLNVNKIQVLETIKEGKSVYKKE